MLYNTEAIVVRTIPYGETNAIVTLLTPTGTVSAMARGAKKPQSRLSAGTRQCAEGIFSIYQRSGMGTIQQVEVIRTRRQLHEKLELAAYAAYFSELVLAIADERPNGDPAVYRLYIGALNRLIAEQDDAGVVARVWEAKVLRMMGVSPEWRSCMRCREVLSGPVFYSEIEGGLLCHSCSLTERRAESLFEIPGVLPRILHTFGIVPWDKLGSIRLGATSTEALKKVLRRQLVQFAGVSPKSLKFIEELNL